MEARAEAQATSSTLHEAKRLTDGLWQRLKHRTCKFDDDCSIRYSGYHVMARYLLRWHGSIYILLWVDMLVWCSLYITLSLVYRLALNDAQKTLFEDVVRMVGHWSGEIPITFLLGFFVSNVVSRWWSMYNMIPKMGGPSGKIRASVLNSNPEKGVDDPQRAELLRKAISRYLNLAWILCIWQFSGHIRERFNILREIIGKVNEIEPYEKRLEHIRYNELYNFRRRRNDPIRQRLENIRVSEKMQATNLELMIQDLCLLNEDPVVKKTYGDLITRSEIDVFTEQARRLQDDEDNAEDGAPAAGCCPRKGPTSPDQFGDGKRLYRVQWWLPLHWALALAEQALEEGLVHDSNTYLTLTSAIQDFAGKLTNLGNYASRNLPLVYTQVVIIAVYTVFFADLLSKQFLDPTRSETRGISGNWLDYYVPVFALLQIIFIVGWFKVALVVMDPFGSDDEDFPLGHIFNGNLTGGIEMCENSGDLYPKKLRPILFPANASDDFDCVHSEPEDSETVLVTAGSRSNTFDTIM